jgi:hypothetical protein
MQQKINRTVTNKSQQKILSCKLFLHIIVTNCGVQMLRLQVRLRARFWSEIVRSMSGPRDEIRSVQRPAKSPPYSAHGTNLQSDGAITAYIQPGICKKGNTYWGGVKLEQLHLTVYIQMIDEEPSCKWPDKIITPESE